MAFNIITPAANTMGQLTTDLARVTAFLNTIQLGNEDSLQITVNIIKANTSVTFANGSILSFTDGFMSGDVLTIATDGVSVVANNVNALGGAGGGGLAGNGFVTSTFAGNTATVLLIEDRMQVANTNTLVDDRMQVANTVPITGGTFTGSVRVDAIAPALQLFETDATTENKGWEVVANTGAFLIRMMSDSFVNGNTFFTVSRTGLNVDAINFKMDSFDLTGAMTLSGIGTYSSRIDLNSNTPIIRFEEADATTQNRNWEFKADAGQFDMLMATNTYSGSNSFMTVARTGNNIDTVTLKADTVAHTGNITVTGTVDGRDVAADGTELDGLGNFSTADQLADPSTVTVSTSGPSGGSDGDFWFEREA